MNWFSGLVLLAVLWFMTLFIVLPLRLTTQGEVGEVVKGTPRSAPEGVSMKRKFLLTTLIALGLWAVCVVVIVSGLITIDDIDLFTYFGGELR